MKKYFKINELYIFPRMCDVLGRAALLARLPVLRLMAMLCVAMFAAQVQAQITFRGATQAFAAGGVVATNITHVGAGASDTRNNCGDISPTIPAGSVGDVLVALVNSRESNAVVTMPGWNQLYAQQHPGRDFVARIYWRRATSAAANGDARTITQAVSCNSIAGQISRFAGVDSLQAFESDPIPAGNAVIQNSNAIDTGSQITSVNNSMLLVASFMENDRSVTEGVGWNESFDTPLNVSRDLGLALAYRTQATAVPAPGSSVSGWSLSSGARNFGIIFALRPGTVPSTSLTINVPPTGAVGDTLITSIAVSPCSLSSGGACTLTLTPPAGWTLMRQIDQTTGGTGGVTGFGNRLAVYRRLVDGTEPASYTWNFGGTPIHAGAVGAISRYTGVDTVSPIVTDAAQATASALTHATPSINTGLVTDTLLVASHAYNSSANWGTPVGMTKAAEASSQTPTNNAGISIVVSYEQFATAGATGARTATPSNPPASDTGTTHLLALRPQPPAAFYKLDEAAWAGANAVVDASGNGRHGTAMGGAVPVLAKVCNGVQLNGSSRYIEVPNLSNMLNATSSLAFWIKTTQTGNDTGWMAPGVTGVELAGGSDDIFWGWLDATGRIGVSVANDFTTKSTVAINNGVWRHVVLTRDHIAGTYKIYIDGILNASGAIATGIIGTAFSSLGRIEDTGGTPEYLDGQLDEIRIYSRVLIDAEVITIRDSTRPCASALNHIRIEHTGVGLTCEPATVTVKACADATCSTLYSGSVTTTLSPTGWVGGDTITFSGGSTTAQLRKTTVVTVALGAGTTTPAAANPTQCFNGLTATCSLEFKDTGFIFSAIPTQIAATTSATHTLQAVRTDNATGVCTGLFTGNVPNIELASECINPGTCQSGQQVTINNNGTGVIAANNGGAVSSWTPRTITFGANSTASFTFSYPDVGAIRLHARYNIAASGNYMSGVTTPAGGFVVKPAGFTVTSVQRTADAVANPGAADAAGAVFIKAGDPITLTVTAVNALGIRTPNYGKESTPEGVLLTNALATGLGLTANPVLGNGTIAGGAFGVGVNAGIATVSNVSWSEVGIITLTPSVGDGSYLGVGDVTGTATGNIGRFTPHHFDVSPNAPMFATACGAGNFTYIGQPFSYASGMAPVLTVTARASGGGQTLNYKGTFFKFTNTKLAQAPYATQAARYTRFDTLGGGITPTPDISGLPLTTVDPAIVDNSNGTATLTFAAGTGLAFTRTTPVLPFDADISIGLNVIDTDDIVYVANPARFGATTLGNGIAFSSGKNMRFGRLRLGNVSGSQLLKLQVPVEAQYWNGTFFITNTVDSCTALATANIGLGNYVRTGAGTTSVNAVTSPLSAGRGTITLNVPASDVRSVDVAVNLGATGTADACPDAPSAFTPAATAANKAYLRSLWCTPPGGYAKDPAARVRFGISGSGDERIYMRENY